MDDPNRIEIDALKNNWRQLLAAHRGQEKLIKMLEEVEGYLTQLEEEFEKPSSHSDEKQLLYHQLKQKKHELDHLLDLVEEITSVDVEVAQDKLITKILEYAPHLAQAYGTLHQALIFATSNEQAYHNLLIDLGKLQVHLALIVNTRIKVTGWGFWRYFLGPSPTAKITREIEKLREATQKLLEQKYKDEEVTLFLKQLNGLCKQKWDFALIDKHYTPLLKSITHLYEQYYYALQASKREKIKLSDALTDWIEQI